MAVDTETDAIRATLAADLAATRAERDELRRDRDELRRQLIHERAERKAERDRAASGRRWIAGPV